MNLNLPQKRLHNTVLKFKEKITCNLALLLNGLEEKNIPKEHIDKIIINRCELPIWPPISKTCEACILKNSPERFITDNKGREFRVIG